MQKLFESITLFFQSFSLTELINNIQHPAFLYGIWMTFILFVVSFVFIIVLKLLLKSKFTGICYQQGENTVTISSKALKSLVRFQLNKIKEIDPQKIVFSYKKETLTVEIFLLLNSPIDTTYIKDQAHQIVEEGLQAIGITEKLAVKLTISDLNTEPKED